MNQREDRRRDLPKRLALAACLMAAAFAVYAPVLESDTRFLWDDDEELWGTHGRLVQDEDGLRTAWLPIQEPAGGWHRVWEWKPLRGHGFWPLTPTVFWLQWRLWGADELWQQGENQGERIAAVQRIANLFHVPNVLLHGASSIVLWQVLARLGIGAPWLIALCFVVHPVNVPSVAWVSELKNTLSLFFLLIAWWLHLKSEARPRAWISALSLVAFFLSLTAKTAAVGFPLFLLACAWWQRGGITRLDLRRAAPFFAMAIPMAASTLWFVGQTGGLSKLVVAPESFLHRIAGAGWALWFYLGKVLLPTDLMMIYPRFDIPWRNPFSLLPGLAFVACAALAWRHRTTWGRSVLFALASFVVFLFPVLGFADMVYMIHSLVSDHFNYIAMIAVVALFVGAGDRFCTLRPYGRTAGRIAGAALVVALGVQAHHRAARFKNHTALWTHNVEVNAEAWMAHYNLGTAIAIEADALQRGPQRRASHQRAASHLQKTVELRPEYELAYHRLARVQSHLGLKRESEATRARAVSIALEGLDSLDPAEYAMGVANGQEDAPEHIRVAKALLRLDRDRFALVHLRRALEVEPGQVDALLELAFLLASTPDPSIRNGEEALLRATAANRSRPLNAAQRLGALHALAAAHAERAVSHGSDGTRGFEIAASLSGMALQLAQQLDAKREVALARERIELYRSGQPLRRASGQATGTVPQRQGLAPGSDRE